MKHRLWALGLGIAVCAMAKPNFSGNWKFDSSKSEYGPMPAPSVFERTVTHDDPKLEVKTRQAGQQGEVTTELKYTTDGKENVNKIRGADVKSTCKWDGDILLIEYKRQTPQGEISVQERWKLSEDGKATVITSKIAGGFGEFEIKVHLDKQ